MIIHDSCVYSRYEGIIQQPRDLLMNAGYRLKEPRNSKKLTHCCGGPIESIFPGTAHTVGKERLEQLKSNNIRHAVTVCPICLATLQKVSNGEIEIDDISTFLAKSYC